MPLKEILPGQLWMTTMLPRNKIQEGVLLFGPGAAGCRSVGTGRSGPGVFGKGVIRAHRKEGNRRFRC